MPSFPLEPVNTTASDPRRTVTFKENQCTVTCDVSSMAELTSLLHRLVYHLPAVINVEFIDAPTINGISGSIGDTPFVWLYDHRIAVTDAVTREQQEQRLILSWRRLNQLRRPSYRRVLAAVHWFHVACRLERAGINPWEFASEILLNLAKILEILFPPSTGTGSIDAARQGLQSMGYPPKEIETWFIPALALRNGLDVAHVSLAQLETAELDVIHAYTEQAERHFRRLLHRVLEQVEQGTFPITPPSADSGNAAKRLIARMAEAVGSPQSG